MIKLIKLAKTLVEQQKKLYRHSGLKTEINKKHF